MLIKDRVMLKKNLFLPLIILLTAFSSCSKSSRNSGCTADQVCTAIFASIGVEFVDKDGNNITVNNITVINLRTNIAVVAQGITDPGFSPNYHTIATDGNKGEFSTNGDNVKVTATNSATNKTVSAVLVISGGCNCHVAKLSGPDKIVFE